MKSIFGMSLVCVLVLAGRLTAQTDTFFTYQGELQDNGKLANGMFDMEFSLWDSDVGGVQFGSSNVFDDVPVADGRFTVDLDFGATSFYSTERWLEIAVEGVTLTPRSMVNRAPYSIQTRGINVAADEDVAVGTTSTTYKFQVYTDERSRAIYGNNFNNDFGNKYGVFGRATSVDGFGVYGVHDATTGTNAGVYGETDSTSADAVGVHGVVDTTSAGNFSAAVRGENQGAGLSGIGVYGSHDGQGWGVYGTTNGGFGRGVFGEVLGGGGIAGYFENEDGIAVFADGADNTGSTAALVVSAGAQTMYIDGNEIDSNSALGLNLNNNVDHDVILADGGGDVRMPNPQSELFVDGTMRPQAVILGFNNTTNNLLTIRAASDSGTTVFHVRFEATGSIGSITSGNGVVSYNAFTGSHFSAVSKSVEPGLLMKMTGENLAVAESRASEPVYGVEPTTAANDPACLGAYLSDYGDEHTENGTKIHLVSAVGNGILWVVDDGRGNIEPGDLLISSDVRGCAMKDDPSRFATGHVVARAAERVVWSNVPADSTGVKRKMMSVLFDATVRTQTSAQQVQKIDSLSNDNNALRKRMSDLELIVQEMKAVIAAGQSQ